MFIGDGSIFLVLKDAFSPPYLGWSDRGMEHSFDRKVHIMDDVYSSSCSCRTKAGPDRGRSTVV